MSVVLWPQICRILKKNTGMRACRRIFAIFNYGQCLQSKQIARMLKVSLICHKKLMTKTDCMLTLYRTVKLQASFIVSMRPSKSFDTDCVSGG